MTELSPRQVHLDFHTSEHIPGVGESFRADEFAKTVKEAYISSMTVFARCHHGWLYYPSKRFPQLIHPSLTNKNLLLEQVRALHKEGIRAPIYITVQWDYQSATTHPDWLVRKLDGSHEGDSFTQPGFYQSLCINTEYYYFLAEQTAEICEMLGDELDGVFFDIVGTRPCWCARCRKEMKSLGFDLTDEKEVLSFAKISMTRFKAKMTRVVREYSDDCTIFYNAGHVGPCTRRSMDSYTHFELESLPSGSWGYLHFPVTARYARTLGLDSLGMTGKFHTEWGDFHSLKNLAALEFECFRMLSYGFASSIGDQLEPNGRLNAASYKLIGQVYKQFAAYEQWARPSKAVVEAAVITPETVSTEFRIPESIMGACQLLEELSLQFDIIDEEQELSGYKLILLPDDLTASPALQAKLNDYVVAGGRIIACAKGGLSKEEQYPSCFGVEYAGMTEKYPDFIIAKGKLSGTLEPDNQYVIYKQGVSLISGGAQPVMSGTAPYFNRAGDEFCSHRYTPSAHGKPYPVVFQNGNVLVFSHPIFTQYRENAPHWCKQLISNALDLLLPTRLVRHNGPSTLSVTLLDQPQHNRYTLQLLSYIPVRKSATIDIIEERTVVNNVELTLSLPKEITTARLVPDGTQLILEDHKLTVAQINGYAVIELCY